MTPNKPKLDVGRSGANSVSMEPGTQSPACVPQPANPPVSPFLQFAATFERFRSNDTDVRNIYGLAPLLRQAERHARLLAQISAIAYRPAEDVKSPHYSADYENLKASLREILELP